MFTTPWLSRMAALLLAFLPLVAGYLWVIDPLLGSHRRADASIAEAQDLLARYDRIAADRTLLEEQAAALVQDANAGASYLADEGEGLAAAALQERITSLIASSGGSMSSVQTLASGEEEGMRRIGIRAQMTTTISPLVGVLYGLETGTPMLFLDNIDIQSRVAPTPPQDGLAAAEPQLIVAFDLYGYQPLVSSK